MKRSGTIRQINPAAAVRLAKGATVKDVGAIIGAFPNRAATIRSFDDGSLELVPSQEQASKGKRLVKVVLERQQPSMNAVVERATAVIGTREKALRWLGTPVRALKFATPISLLGSAAGQQAVLTVLGRLEHGVF